MPDRRFSRRADDGYPAPNTESARPGGGLTDEELRAAADRAVRGMTAPAGAERFDDLPEVLPPTAKRGRRQPSAPADSAPAAERGKGGRLSMDSLKSGLGSLRQKVVDLGEQFTRIDTAAGSRTAGDPAPAPTQAPPVPTPPPAPKAEQPRRPERRAPQLPPDDDFDLDLDFDDEKPQQPAATGRGFHRRGGGQTQPEQPRGAQTQPEGNSPRSEQPRRAPSVNDTTFAERTSRTAGAAQEGRIEIAPDRRPQFAETPSASARMKRSSDGYYVPSIGEPVENGMRYSSRYRHRNRRPMKIWLKTALTVTAIALVFSLIVTGTFTALIKARVNYKGDSIHNGIRLTVAEQQKLYAEETEIIEDAAAFTKPDLVHPADKDVELILVVSADNRLGTERSAICDALMLCAIDYRNNDVKLVSIMPDLYVRIPGYYSNKISKAFYYDTALGDYSMPTLLATVEENLGVVPDAYVVVDFDAIQKMVACVGGVEMELSEEEALYMSTDPKYGLFPRYTGGGTYLMSGPETLNYIRMKKVGSGEFDRTARQRKVMLQLLRKLGKMSFVEMSVFTYSMLPELPTNLSKKDVWKLFKHAKSIAKLAGKGVSADEQPEQIKIYEQIIPVVGSWRDGEATVLDETFGVTVTNLTFTANAVQDFIYNDDKTYLSGQLAEGVNIPEVAPLPVSGTEETEEGAEGETAEP